MEGWLLVGRGPGRGWPCVTQGLACVTETAETAETADRYMRFWPPTKETQPRSTKRNPNSGRTLHPRDAMDMAAKAERDAAVEQARDSIREQMTPEIRDQARREAMTEVCSFATRAFR
eukprot:COSAG04_NODE_465_length_13935_cov_24.262142_5_plen_118_part_00